MLARRLFYLKRFQTFDPASKDIMGLLWLIIAAPRFLFDDFRRRETDLLGVIMALNVSFLGSFREITSGPNDGNLLITTFEKDDFFETRFDAKMKR